ncbi:MAG: DJ-1/PfpI family protein [Geminicoccaceae bacterium]
MTIEATAKTRATVPARVAILAYDGVDELDLFGAYSVLAKAQAAGALNAAGIYAPYFSVTGSGGAEFRTYPLNCLDRESCMLVVPGGSGSAAAAHSGVLAGTLRDAYRRGLRIYCCCSGALIVASALELANGQLAIHERKRAELQTLFGGEVVVGLVESNGIISIGGRRSPGVKSVDLAFRLLSDIDPKLPRSISQRTEIEWPRQ